MTNTNLENDNEDPEFDCEFCDDTGWQELDETDSDGNVARGVGGQVCACRLHNDDDDDHYDNMRDNEL